MEHTTAEFANHVRVTLTFLNCVLVVVMLGGLVAIARLHRRQSTGFTQEAYLYTLVPLLVGVSAWSLEYSLELWHVYRALELSSIARTLDCLLNTIVSLAFLISGGALLRFRRRIHSALQDETPQGLHMTWARLAFGNRIVLMTLAGAMLLLLASSVLLVFQGNPGRAALLQALTAAVGMSVLGLGLLRALTREAPELVSVLCGASVLLYAPLQVMQVQEGHVWFFWTRTLALLLKVTLLVAVGAFWTLVSRIERVRVQERDVAEEKRRTVLSIFNQLHLTAKDKLASIKANALLVQRACREHMSPVASRTAVDRLDDAISYVDDVNRYIRERGQGTEGVEPVDLGRVRRRLADMSAKGYRVTTAIEGTESLPADVSAGLAEIGLEALRNIEKHAGARHVRFELRVGDGVTRMTIDDDGMGVSESRRQSQPTTNGTSGYGLHSILQTARAIGGTAHVSSNPHAGTKIVVTI